MSLYRPMCAAMCAAMCADKLSLCSLLTMHDIAFCECCLICSHCLKCT